MRKITLTDENGKKYQAQILFTYFDYFYGKDYLVYQIDNDILAASFKKVNNRYLINSDLTSSEYDMLDKQIAMKLGEDYA